jgi:hypothetical protein
MEDICITQCKIFPHGVGDGHCCLKHVRCFMYFYIKQVILDETIIYFNIKQCDRSKWLLLKYVTRKLFHYPFNAD